jgi:oligosaccharide reducing-end xylanase
VMRWLRSLKIVLLAAVAGIAFGTEAAASGSAEAKGAFMTKTYRNVFKEYGYSDQAVRAKIDEAWNALFYGDDDTRIYFEASPDEAYIMDIGNGDVRSEGMSYGMMMCVQLDKKAEFDKLWKWAKTRMQQGEGFNKGFFAWSLKPDGTPNDTGPAPDGEEYFALALFFASHRWGDGPEPFDYGEQARFILREALHKPDAQGAGHNLWDRETRLIRFTPSSQITDPSYHLPHFYELFSLWADDEDSAFWKEAAAASRAFLKTACNPKTGLAPDYAGFGGYPIPTGGHDKFSNDAYRVAGNIGLDYLWFAADPWERELANRIQAFFVKEGIGKYYGKYKIDGTPVKSAAYQATGLVAMNAMASLAANGPNARAMVKDLWSKAPLTGQGRYFDDCLYMFSLLALSGNYRIW